MPATAANDTPRRRPGPPWMEAARDTWGDTFGAKSPRALGAALDDWSELSVDEQTFTVGRLLYLNLLAHRTTQRLLEKVVAGLDQVADTVAGFDGPREEDEEEAGEPAPAAPAGTGNGGPPEPPVPPAAPAVVALSPADAAPEPAVEVEVLDPEDATPFDEEDAA